MSTMSAYSITAPMLPQQDVPHPTAFIPQYPQLPPSPNCTQRAPQAYMNVDPQLNHGGGQVQADPRTLTQTPPKGKKGESSSEIKARLRKACDSCSIRKVKCDETGPPCKACIGLQIPCTFNRQSKRRGPPNRHAESLKKGRFDLEGGSGQSQPASPTHAAQTLAAFAQQQVLSADSICPWPVLESLVDDYFIYIHPLVPLPHKPTFYHKFRSREDMSDPTFLALLASMVGCLVASFPHRPRQHFRAHGIEHAFPSPMSFVDRCHQVAMQAQGTGYLDRHLTIYDAIISYLQGLICTYTYNQHGTLLYFKQCLSFLTTLGAHKERYAQAKQPEAPQARMIPNGHALEGPQPEVVDYILQELSRRTFWVLFVSIRSLQHLGISHWELPILPETKASPYPALPLEVDDDHITPTQILQQPQNIISELTGFNINVRIYTTCNDLATIELVHGIDQVVDWDRQKRVLEHSLQAVKRILETLPPELLLDLQPLDTHSYNQTYPPPATALSGLQEMDYYANHGFDNRPMDYNRINELRRIQNEIQKANIYASQLATRSYLLEKHRTLSDANSRNSETTPSSPSAIAPILNAHSQSTTTPSMTEQALANEREDVTKSLLATLSSITNLNTEPSGISFIIKIRQIASTLLDQPPPRKGTLALRAEDHLRSFVGVLMKLERGDLLGGGEGGDGDGDEDARILRCWKEMRGYQARFVQGGGVGGL